MHLNAKSVTILIFLFVIGLGVTLSYQKIQRTISVNALPENAVLSLSADPPQLQKGQEFTVSLLIDSEDSEVAAADFVVDFDPKRLKVISVSTGNFFINYPVNATGKNFVKISGVASFDGETLTLPKGKGTIGNITFQALESAGKTDVSFNKSKTIVATAGKNILDKKKLAKTTIEVLWLKKF